MNITDIHYLCLYLFYFVYTNYTVHWRHSYRQYVTAFLSFLWWCIEQEQMGIQRGKEKTEEDRRTGIESGGLAERQISQAQSKTSDCQLQRSYTFSQIKLHNLTILQNFTDICRRPLLECILLHCGYSLCEASWVVPAAKLQIHLAISGIICMSNVWERQYKTVTALLLSVITKQYG